MPPFINRHCIRLLLLHEDQDFIQESVLESGHGCQGIGDVKPGMQPKGDQIYTAGNGKVFRKHQSLLKFKLVSRSESASLSPFAHSSFKYSGAFSSLRRLFGATILLILSLAARRRLNFRDGSNHQKTKWTKHIAIIPSPKHGQIGSLPHVIPVFIKNTMPSFSWYRTFTHRMQYIYIYYIYVGFEIY